jgi:hypothetical protein
MIASTRCDHHLITFFAAAPCYEYFQNQEEVLGK